MLCPWFVVSGVYSKKASSFLFLDTSQNLCHSYPPPPYKAKSKGREWLSVVSLPFGRRKEMQSIKCNLAGEQQIDLKITTVLKINPIWKEKKKDGVRIAFVSMHFQNQFFSSANSFSASACQCFSCFSPHKSPVTIGVRSDCLEAPELMLGFIRHKFINSREG